MTMQHVLVGYDSRWDYERGIEVAKKIPAEAPPCVGPTFVLNLYLTLHPFNPVVIESLLIPKMRCNLSLAGNLGRSSGAYCEQLAIRLNL